MVEHTLFSLSPIDATISAYSTTTSLNDDQDFNSTVSLATSTTILSSSSGISYADAENMMTTSSYIESLSDEDLEKIAYSNNILNNYSLKNKEISKMLVKKL